MIRNVCIHVENEQPLLCDLFDLPTQADAGLVCTNVRMLDGKRPVFIDQTASTFFFPYHVVRFLEIPAHEMARHQAGPRRASGTHAAPVVQDDAATYDPADDLPEQESLLPVAVGAPEPAPDEEAELEIDEGFLQRIRDI